MLNNSGESGPSCLVPDLRGNAFSFSPLRIMFAGGLSYMAMYDKPMANIILNGEKIESIPPKIRSKTRVPTFITII